MRCIGICLKVVGGLPQLGHGMRATAALRNMREVAYARAQTHTTYGKKSTIPSNGNDSATRNGAETKYPVRRDACRLREHRRLHSAMISGLSVARCFMATGPGVRRRRSRPPWAECQSPARQAARLRADEVHADWRWPDLPIRSMQKGKAGRRRPRRINPVPRATTLRCWRGAEAARYPGAASASGSRPAGRRNRRRASRQGGLREAARARASPTTRSRLPGVALPVCRAGLISWAPTFGSSRPRRPGNGQPSLNERSGADPVWASINATRSLTDALGIVRVRYPACT